MNIFIRSCRTPRKMANGWKPLS